MPLPADVELFRGFSTNTRNSPPEHRGRTSPRQRTSAFAGSRIRVHDHELEVVEIGPFIDAHGRAVTFRGRSVGAVRVRAGAIVDTRWGTCEVVA